MGLRFRRSFKLFPGVHLNLSKGGISASIGVPGATLNVGPRGLYSTVGIPGTGLSYRTRHVSENRSRPNFTAPDDGSPSDVAPEPSPSDLPDFPSWHSNEMREIGSAGVEQLTSENLHHLRELLAEAQKQRAEIESDLGEARALLHAQQQELRSRQRSLFRYFYKNRIEDLLASIQETSKEVDRLSHWLESTHIEIKFDTSPSASLAFAAMIRAFDALRAVAKIWDITSDRKTQRGVERTAASRVLNRAPVKFDFSSSDIVRFDGRAMRLENSNGEDILIFPGMALMPRADGMFALVDLRDLTVIYTDAQFIEEQTVPSDARIVDQAWAKSNKDGSPDLRFRDNYAIPICLYGSLIFKSQTGIEEEYQFSDARPASEFARAFLAYQQTLRS